MCIDLSNYTSTKKLNINLLSFKDICLIGYYIETNNEKDMKYLYISTIELKNKNVYWRNYQHSLMVYTTRILVQLKCMSW